MGTDLQRFLRLALANLVSPLKESGLHFLCLVSGSLLLERLIDDRVARVHLHVLISAVAISAAIQSCILLRFSQSSSFHQRIHFFKIHPHEFTSSSKILHFLLFQRFQFLGSYIYRRLFLFLRFSYIPPYPFPSACKYRRLNFLLDNSSEQPVVVSSVPDFELLARDGSLLLVQPERVQLGESAIGNVEFERGPGDDDCGQRRRGRSRWLFRRGRVAILIGCVCFVGHFGSGRLPRDRSLFRLTARAVNLQIDDIFRILCKCSRPCYPWSPQQCPPSSLQL